MQQTDASERTTIDLPAGRVHYRVSGPERGRPVVFVHGFLVDDTLWSDVPERLGAAGFRAYAPTWPLASHTEAMKEGADLSPRGVARVVASFLEALDLDDVVIVGNDTGGGIAQLLLDEDPNRVGGLVLTNCDAFEDFPPAPFDTLFRVARHPWLALLLLQTMRSTTLRHSSLAFGPMVRRRIEPGESRPWVRPYLTDAAVRRDVASFTRAWRPGLLTGSASWLGTFHKPVLLCWAPEDPTFEYALAKRLLATFPDATLVEFRDASTFVPMDEPGRLAEEIAAWAGRA
ncbi:MAG TPA: alpha/beta hydrolase [Nocardioides sp.]|uniref:alpha/beta fold hydrolase n=1 Tax=Nocardioides sp. TaxID=35761 RepID=UPI002E32042A|nr:alpha/beta hydrolase [Nocardioides sp.]HEX5088774.1 alpha/beta hydrolase [Nocardioides sp.]